MADCLSRKGRVADYADWRYAVTRAFVALPDGEWIGQLTADNLALFINFPTIPTDFEGEGPKFTSRPYHCVREKS